MEAAGPPIYVLPPCFCQPQQFLIGHSVNFRIVARQVWKDQYPQYHFQETKCHQLVRAMVMRKYWLQKSHGETVKDSGELFGMYLEQPSEEIEYVQHPVTVVVLMEAAGPPMPSAGPSYGDEEVLAAKVPRRNGPALLSAGLEAAGRDAGLDHWRLYYCSSFSSSSRVQSGVWQRSRVAL